MIVSFSLDIDPPTATHQEKRVSFAGGRPHFYEDGRLRAARSLLMSALAAHVPPDPLDGPLQLTTVWRYATKRSHKDGEYRSTKPDTDNIAKLLKDCMTRSGYWQDDAQVADERIIKTWTRAEPGISIEIRQLGAVYYEDDMQP